MSYAGECGVAGLGWEHGIRGVLSDCLLEMRELDERVTYDLSSAIPRSSQNSKISHQEIPSRGTTRPTLDT